MRKVILFSILLFTVSINIVKSDASDYFDMNALSKVQKINQTLNEYITVVSFAYAPSDKTRDMSFLVRCKDSGSYMQVIACVYRKDVSHASSYNIFTDYPNQLEIVNRRKEWMLEEAKKADNCGYTTKCINQFSDNIYDIAADTINEQAYSFIRNAN